MGRGLTKSRQASGSGGRCAQGEVQVQQPGRRSQLTRILKCPGLSQEPFFTHYPNCLPCRYF